MKLRSRLGTLGRRLAETPEKDNGGMCEPQSEITWRKLQASLRCVQRELVELSAARRRLDDQLERLRLRAHRAEERACLAIVAGHDDQARFLLMRKRAAIRQLALLVPQRELLQADELRLAKRERILALRLEASRQRKRTLLVRKASSGVRLRPAPGATGEPYAHAPEPDWRPGEPESDRRSA